VGQRERRRALDPGQLQPAADRAGALEINGKQKGQRPLIEMNLLPEKPRDDQLFTTRFVPA
jgi:hypothetical protein